MPVTTSNTANFKSASLASSVTSASTTYVSTGTGVAVTPASTGNVLVVSTGPCGNTTGNGVKVKIYRTTGAIPANNVAVTGTALTSEYTFTFLTGVLASAFSTMDVDTGPTIGTAYNYYIAYASVTGGSATISSAGPGVATITAIEI
jgi:hypothetical protein